MWRKLSLSNFTQTSNCELSTHIISKYRAYRGACISFSKGSTFPYAAGYGINSEIFKRYKLIICKIISFIQYKYTVYC